MADNQKKWFVEFPLYKYKEDVVKLARENDLEIVDALYKNEFDEKFHALDAPKITKKTDKQVAKTVEAAQSDSQSSS